jgi:glycosyltransferase involved in cell wall biosynthesis
MANPLVTQVLWKLGRGGAERIVFDMARRLPEHGFDVRVLAAGGSGEMESDFREANISLSINPGPTNGSSAIAFLRGEIASRRPAIWHTHLTPVWAGLAARSSRLRPWVATAHGFEAELPWLKRQARALAYRAADRVVCVSDAVRVSLPFLDAKHVSIIHPGIDLKHFLSREPRLAGDAPELLVVSRLVPEKGIDVLLEALSGLLRPWRLTIAGDGPEMPTLRRRAELLGIVPRVRFLGTVADPAPLYRRADLFCFPSRSEGQGMALLEASACRLPAVSSDLPAIREAFDEQSVAFASAGNVDAWRHALERSLARYPEALTRAERASRIVTSRYSLDGMIDAHTALYRNLLGNATMK